MSIKLIIILVLLACIATAITGMTGNYLVDLSAGQGATARGQGQKAVMDAKANALNAKTASDTKSREIANQDQAIIDQMTRDQRAANLRNFFTILTWTGAISAGLVMIGFGLGFAGYAILMGLIIRPKKEQQSAEIDGKGPIITVWLPEQETYQTFNLEIPGQVITTDNAGTKLIEGQPGPMIAASLSLASGKRNMSNPQLILNSGFIQALAALNTKPKPALSEPPVNQREDYNG
jgi:hypothetical protein